MRHPLLSNLVKEDTPLNMGQTVISTMDRILLHLSFFKQKKLLSIFLVFLHILGKQSGFDNLWHACLIIEYKFGNAQYIFFLMLPGLKHCQTYVRMILMIIAEPSIISQIHIYVQFNLVLLTKLVSQKTVTKIIKCH